MVKGDCGIKMIEKKKLQILLYLNCYTSSLERCTWSCRRSWGVSVNKHIYKLRV